MAQTKTPALLTLFLLSTTAAFAQVSELPEIVISAHQIPVESNKVGAAVTVLNGNELRARGLVTTADALRTVPGVMVNQGGNAGSLTQVRVRGSEANHTLVMIDGVPAQRLDEGDFDWADFLLDDIERIEVVRGPQSGIAGANAHAGLISIFTKSGRGLARPEAEYRLEGGTQNSHRESASFRGATGPFYGAITFQNRETGGYNISRMGNERDGHRAWIATAKGGLDIGNLNVEGSVRHVNRDVQYDPEFFIPVPDVYGRDKFRSTQGRIAVTHTAFDGGLMQRFGASMVDQHYRSEWRGGPFLLSPFLVDSDATFLDYKATAKYGTGFFGGEQHSLTLVLDQAREHYKHNFGADADRTRRGIAAEHLVDLPWGLALATALRRDFNDAFADVTTWRVTGSQLVAGTGTRLHASVGKGVTNPTFTEQFGFFPGFVGNPSLRPESSIGWDFGGEQRWLDGRLITDVTYFSADVQDAIAPAGVTVVNLPGTSTRRGVEITLQYSPTDLFQIDASYTYTDARRPNGQAELRRPRHTGSVNVTAFSPDQRGRATLGVSYNGRMQDGETFNLPNRVDLPAFTVASAILSYDLTPSATVYVRAENLFDKSYEEVFSYRARGFTAYAGLRVKLGGE